MDESGIIGQMILDNMGKIKKSSGTLDNQKLIPYITTIVSSTAKILDRQTLNRVTSNKNYLLQSVTETLILFYISINQILLFQKGKNEYIFMIILILFSSVFCIQKPVTTYIITQNESTLYYEIEINKKQYIIDLINEFSVSEENAQPQTCNQYYQCQYCNSYCIYSIYDLQDHNFNGTLQENVIKINNYQNKQQIEELTTIKGESNLLGLGVRRNQTYSNFTFPYNPFLSDITSICFANVGFIHKNSIFTENKVKIKYDIIENKYGVQFHGIQLAEQIYLKIENYVVQFDSLNPYTKIPSELFTQLFAYYKSLGYSLIGKGFISIHKNKFDLNKMEPIRFYINETFYLQYEPKQFLYFQGDYIQLAFMRKNQPYIIQGTAFLTNLYMTINQNEQSIVLSQLDCEKEIYPEMDNYYYYVIVIVSLLVITILSFKLWRKKQIYTQVTKGQGAENQVELQNQQSTLEKEDDEMKI